MVDIIHASPPIPMDGRLLELAVELKAAGLPWEPAVGCFVWDQQGRIAVPSPFPGRVYFILSMKRFLAIFGSVEEMKRQLVWLPTWYQARQVLGPLQSGRRDRVAGDVSSGRALSAEDEMVVLYRSILQQLQASGRAPHSPPVTGAGARQSEWIRAATLADLGDIRHLPAALRDRIRSVYREVAGAYLGWRRIQEGQSEDWLPEQTSFDADLLAGLGHFYSDYQASIRSMDRLRQAVRLLAHVDAEADRATYDRIVAIALGASARPLSDREILDQLQP